MSKQKTAHEIIVGLTRSGYSFRQLSEFYGLTPSTLHAMCSKECYRESAEVRNLLNANKPRFKPRWPQGRGQHE